MATGRWTISRRLRKCQKHGPGTALGEVARFSNGDRSDVDVDVVYELLGG